MYDSKHLHRPSGRVREKNENCALFWGRCVGDKKLIVRDCAILRGTKYFVLTPCQSKHQVLLINHTFSCNINVKFLL